MFFNLVCSSSYLYLGSTALVSGKLQILSSLATPGHPVQLVSVEFPKLEASLLDCVHLFYRRK